MNINDGAKGVISKIISNDKSAYAEESGIIDAFISPISVFGRKNLALIKEVYLGKLTDSLNKKIIKLADNPKIKTESIVKLIMDYYKILGSENTKKMISNKLNSVDINKLRNYIKEGNFHLYTIIEPFHNVSFEMINSAAKLLDVDLDEKVTIITDTGEKITTDKAVPVTICGIYL